VSEYLLSNEIVTLAVNLEDRSWRIVGGPVIKALNFEWDTGKLLASAGGKVVIHEAEGILDDDGDSIPYQLETPGALIDVAHKGLVKTVWIEVNTRGQALLPRLVLDDGVLVTLSEIVTTQRETVELRVNQSARIVGVRLVGNLTDQVDLYGIELDIDAPIPERQE